VAGEKKLLKITLRKSLIDMHKKNKAILRALGLRRIRQSVLQPDNAAVRGMIRKVSQYVDVKEVSE
jgi:large subunit ribosomal protein L30